MRARSWMAPLALVSATSIALAFGVAAQNSTTRQDDGASQEQRRPAAPDPDAPSRTPGATIPVARLSLVIAGLGRDGCDVEVKPGNASCKFRAINGGGVEGRQHVPPAGTVSVELRQVEVRGADRMLTVAVTVHEPGHASKTVYRGFRLPGRSAEKDAPAASAVPTFTCFMSAPSKLARNESDRARK